MTKRERIEKIQAKNPVDLSLAEQIELADYKKHQRDTKPEVPKLKSEIRYSHYSIPKKK